MQLKDHSSGWADERCDILLWLTMNSDWRARQAHSGKDMDLFLSVMLPYSLSTQLPSCLPSLSHFTHFWMMGPMAEGSCAPITPSHHHPKSLPDSLKGHREGMVFLSFFFFLFPLFAFCICEVNWVTFTYRTLCLCQGQKSRWILYGRRQGLRKVYIVQGTF